MSGFRSSPGLSGGGGEAPRDTPPTTSYGFQHASLGFPCPFDDAPPPPLCPFVESPAVADCSHTSQCSGSDDADLTSLLSDTPGMAGALPPYEAIARRASGFDGPGSAAPASQSSTSPHRPASAPRIVRPRPIAQSLSGSDTGTAAAGGTSSLQSIRTTTGVLTLRRSPPPAVPSATPPSKTLSIPIGTVDLPQRRSSRNSAVVPPANTTAVPAMSVTVGGRAALPQRSSIAGATEPKGAGPERSYTKLFVGQIPSFVNAKPWLAELFAPFHVREILVRGHSERATAFVWCGSRDDAEAAVAALNGYKYENNSMWYSLCVEPSKSSFK